MHAAAAYPAFSSAGVTDAQETAYQEVFAADKTVQRSVPSVFHWSPDGSQVAFVTGDASAAGDVPKGLGAEGQGPEVHVVDVATGRAVFQVPIDVLAQRVGRLCGQAVSAGQLAQSLLAIGPLGVRFMACEQLIDVDLRSGAPTVAQGVTPTDLAARRPRVIGSTFPKSAFFSNAILESAAPDGGAFFGVVNDNIYVRSVGGEPVLVAQDGDPARPWALESAVWSADGRSVAVLRRDNSAVATTPLVDWLDGYGVSTALPAPVAGAKLPMLDLYVIDVRAQK
ncbi:MAG: DPP IV N-terminal domain-containing protein, partial [Pseudomonadota bacterium]